MQSLQKFRQKSLKGCIVICVALIMVYTTIHIVVSEYVISYYHKKHLAQIAKLAKIAHSTKVKPDWSTDKVLDICALNKNFSLVTLRVEINKNFSTMAALVSSNQNSGYTVHLLSDPFIFKE